jgi:hypothetical protein
MCRTGDLKNARDVCFSTPKSGGSLIRWPHCNDRARHAMKGDRNPEGRRPCSCIGLAFGQRAPIANAAMRFRKHAIAIRHRSRAIDWINRIDRMNRPDE